MIGDLPPALLWTTCEVAQSGPIARFSDPAQVALRWPYGFGALSEESPSTIPWRRPSVASMRKSALVAAMGSAVLTGGAITALTVLPSNSVGAQTSGTTDTTVAEATQTTPTTAASGTTTTTAASAAAAAADPTTTTTVAPSASSATPTTTPSTRACTPNEDPAHEGQESAEREAAENAGQCQGGPHDGPGGRPGPGGAGFSPNEDPTHEAGESPEREAQEHSSTTSTTTPTTVAP